MPTANTVAVRVAIDNAKEAIAALRGIQDGGEAAFQSLIGGANKASAALERIPGAANQNIQGFRRFGEVARQAGFQVGDFAVQVQSGTNIIVAGTQQLSQFAGAFGIYGAALGGVLAVGGAVISYFTRQGEEAQTAQERLEELTQGTKTYKDALEATEPLQRAFLQNLIDSQKTIDDTAGYYERLVNWVGGLNRTFADLKETQATGVGVGTREGIQNLIRGREREDKAIDEYLNRNKPGIIARAETKPGLEARDYYQEGIKAAEAAAAAAKTANDKRIADAERTAKELQRLEDARADDFADSLRRDLEADNKYLDAKQAAYADAYQKIADENDKALEEEQRARDRESERQADIYAQPFKDLTTNLSSTLSEGIQDALSGEFDFQTFSEGFSEIFADTLAASITSVLAPSLNAAADEFGKAIASAFAKEAAGGAAARSAAGVGGVPGGVGQQPATQPSGLSYGSAALGGAAAGGIAGGLYGQYGPGMKPGNQAALGGAIGGGLGAAAGFAIGTTFGMPILGAVGGAALGTAAGAGIGGLFGGQNNLGNDRSAQAYRAGRGITYGDTSFSAENRAITEGILSEIQRLEEAFVDLGGTVGDVKLRIEAGSKTGITVDGKKYATAEDALVASIEKLIGETTGLTPSMQTVLANTKATSAADIGVDLGIAAQFDEMTFSGTELERQLVALDAQMAAFGKKAAELGLDINAVAAAHENERQALIAADQANKNQILAQIDALAPSGNALELQLRQLNDQVQALAAAATDAGLPLDDLAAAHQRAAAQLVAANDNLTTSLLNQVSALDPAANQLELALSNLNQQVQALAAQLVAAGLPVEALAATHQRAAAALVAANAQLQQSLALQVQILGAGPNDQLGIALAQLDQQVQGLAAQIIATGGSLDELAAAHQRAGAGIIEDFRQREALAASQAAADRQRAREQAAAAAAQARAEAEARAEATRNYATQLTLLEADPLNAIVVNIQERIRQLIEEGKKLGLTAQTERQIKAAGARLEKQAIADYQKSIDDRVRSFQQQSELLEADELGSALIQIRERFREILEVGKELNILPETKREIEAAQARAEQAAREQTARNRSAFRVQLEGFGAANDNDLGRQLRQLDIEFAELGERAEQLLIPLSEVTAAHARAAEELREADRELRRQFLREVSLVDATDLERELARIDDQFRALIKTSIELGYATNVLRQEQAEAEAEAIEATRKRLRETDRSLGGAQRDVFGQIDQYLDPIKQLLGPTGVGQGVYSGAATAGGTLEEFRKTLALARGGDVGALQGIGGIGQSAIQAARVFGASGAQAAAAFKEVTEGFREVAGKLEEKRTALVQQGLTYQKVMIDEQIRQRVEVVEELKLLRAELARSLALANQRKSA